MLANCVHDVLGRTSQEQLPSQGRDTMIQSREETDLFMDSDLRDPILSIFPKMKIEQASVRTYETLNRHKTVPA